MDRNGEFEKVKCLLEAFGEAGTPVIVFDNLRLTEAGAQEVEKLRHHFRLQQIAIMPVPVEWLRELYVFAAPEALERHRDGFPILICGVEIEQREANPKNRPPDHGILRTAKAALEIETFRLAGRQAGVESARNTRARNLTKSEARDRAAQTIAEAVWRGGRHATLKEKMSRFKGLIDRGRDLIPGFFGVPAAKRLIDAEKADVLARKNEQGTAILGAIEHDNVTRAADMARNESQAHVFCDAMSAWSENLRFGEPISLSEGHDLTNARPERMTAPALMKVAIAGDLNPADIHKNLLIERPRFEVGSLIGRMFRGHSAEFGRSAAAILKSAMATVSMGTIRTQSDSCDVLLADAALACHDLAYWTETLDRIIETGFSERIPPKIPPEATIET
jgi:hypothetical protein